MCDTLIALSNSTKEGVVLFAKNSDREPNEAHLLVRIPHAIHSAQATVKCTYIEIPQVQETLEALLAKPFWLWGCEMGANECGVVIGNEAVFTKEPHQKIGLTGMDLIRLGLERGDTARKALEVIAELTFTYGQGGPCGLTRKSLMYHNSYIIADPYEAWVLETAGRYWAAEKVRDVRTISNGLTIGSTWDLASPGLVEHAIERGWCRTRDEFHFAKAYTSWLYTRFGESAARQQRTTDLLRAQKGYITEETMMDILRDHGRGGSMPEWTPNRGSNKWVCAHAADPLVCFSETTGSLVARLAENSQTYWVTGTASPCTSLFKPLYLGQARWPDLGREPAARYDEGTLWWAHERLHRRALMNYPAFRQLVRPELDEMQKRFLAEERAMRVCTAGESAERQTETLSAFSARCFAEAQQATQQWIAKMEAFRPRGHTSPLYRLFWRWQNRAARFPETK